MEKVISHYNNVDIMEKSIEKLNLCRPVEIYTILTFTTNLDVLDIMINKFSLKFIVLMLISNNVDMFYEIINCRKYDNIKIFEYINNNDIKYDNFNLKFQFTRDYHNNPENLEKYLI